VLFEEIHSVELTEQSLLQVAERFSQDNAQLYHRESSAILESLRPMLRDKSSKAYTEHAAASYHDSFFASDDAAVVATARAGNVLGGGDWSRERLVPDLVRALLSGEQLGTALSGLGPAVAALSRRTRGLPRPRSIALAGPRPSARLELRPRERRSVDARALPSACGPSRMRFGSDYS
jgi:hypothetical protein